MKFSIKTSFVFIIICIAITAANNNRNQRNLQDTNTIPQDNSTSIDQNSTTSTIQDTSQVNTTVASNNGNTNLSDITDQESTQVNTTVDSLSGDTNQTDNSIQDSNQLNNLNQDTNQTDINIPAASDDIDSDSFADSSNSTKIETEQDDKENTNTTIKMLNDLTTNNSAPDIETITTNSNNNTIISDDSTPVMLNDSTQMNSSSNDSELEYFDGNGNVTTQSFNGEEEIFEEETVYKTQSGEMITSDTEIYDFNFINLTIGSNNNHTFLPCTSYIIQTNYKRTNLSFAYPSNIQQIMVVDQAINQCNLQTLTCPSNSKFCNVFKPNNDNQGGIIINYCLNSIYVYILAENYKQSSSIAINATYLNDYSCTVIPQTNYVQCAIMSQTDCQAQDPCSGKCIWTNCTYKDIAGQNQTAFGMCLPYSTSKFEMDVRCSDAIKSTAMNKTIAVANFCINREEYQKHSTFLLILLIVLGMLLVFFIASVICYRYYLTNKKVALFTPPAFVPDFIYPKPEENNPPPAVYQRYDDNELNVEVGTFERKSMEKK